MKIDVLLVDDHSVVLGAVKTLLEPFHRVVGTARDGLSAVLLAEELRPSLILLDIHMPGLNGLDTCELLLKRVPESKIIFLTLDENVGTLKETIRRGASGYVLKISAPVELPRAIQQVMAGRIYIPPRITQERMSVFLARAKGSAQGSVREKRLTGRQRELLELLVEGKSMKQAADVLEVTPRTAALDKRSAMQLLGVRDAAELVRFAARSDLWACGARVPAKKLPASFRPKVCRAPKPFNAAFKRIPEDTPLW